MTDPYPAPDPDPRHEEPTPEEEQYFRDIGLGRWTTWEREEPDE